ncbi:MAG: hypothetical protein FH751_05535 [Firmicutes bacterium]|nr:hypothetical protein [Bacillota bacterium]
MDDKNNYKIIVSGHIDINKNWFDSLDMKLLPKGKTQIYGHIKDQSELQGILSKIRDLGLEILLVKKINYK